MNDISMQALRSSSYLSGSSAAYVEELYENYLNNPQSVESHWRDYFASLQPVNDVAHSEIRTYFTELANRPTTGNATSFETKTDTVVLQKQANVLQLVDAYRAYGHYQAKLDPLGLSPLKPIKDLELTTYGLDQSDLKIQFNVFGALGLQTASLEQIIATLKATYCNTLGFEFCYLTDRAEKQWLQERIETTNLRTHFSTPQKQRILKKLTEAEILEKYLGAKFVAQKRFSLEGGDSLIPLLDEIIQRASDQSVKEIIMGMAHRGRLNVLINIFGKEPTTLFKEFEGKYENDCRSGDVKYHKGYSTDLQTEKGVMHLSMGFNPSHLEIINPVIEGSVRARQQRRNDKERNQVIPVLMHGDAAFAGQGIVMETFALSQTRGYGTGGTVHIVTNNQVGFTTSNPQDARSGWYCTDIAKMVEAPIIHVNGDDPEAVVYAAQLALDFRMVFNKDVVIDLVCYRRHGHNEADEPAATQPLMYQNIKQHPTTRKLYADQLIAANVIQANQVDELVAAYREAMDAGREVVEKINGKHHDPFAVNWEPYLGKTNKTVKTAVAAKKLQTLAIQLETLPADATLQPQVAKVIDDRRKMTAGELPMNWGYAENLAYASLLDEGYSVRISGQDCGRGTFSHRHAALHDFKNGKVYIPLQQIAKQPASFTVVDSVLSEAAVMGFEYGYAASSPETLVIWEAQYGDFVNGAQVVIDQFLSSSEQKWDRYCGLTLFLPHGMEGSGPEHSSARLERFLQLCAEDNMQVCVPTTPAQAFHMLRRQMLQTFRKPLIVMTPKSLLRHKLAISSFDDLEQGQFETVIPEIDELKPANIKRVVFCSGKVYYDLLEQRRANKQADVAIIRVEQLYPFPEKEVKAQLDNYKKAKEIIWCQEEPKNQGSWYFIYPYLQECIGKDQSLHFVGRDAAAAPAVGSPQLHNQQQKKLIEEALK